MAQTQFYKAKIQIGGVSIPCLPNISLQCPENFNVPPILGNLWQVNYVEGLRMPVVDVTPIVRDKTGEVLSTTFLNYFLSRSSDAAHDTTAISGGVTFWNGRDAFNLLGAKGDSFSIGTSKGDDLRMACRFCGTEIEDGTEPATYGPWGDAQPLRFQSATLGGALDDIMWSFDIMRTNNHTPSLELDGTIWPTGMNAGPMGCGARFTMQADQTFPANGSSASVTITGTGGKTRTLTLAALICESRNNRNVGAGRVMRQYDCTVLGTNAAAPLTISGSGF